MHELWQTIGRRWAAVLPARGDEFVLAQQTQSQQTFKIRCRAFPALTTAHRLLFGQRVFQIVAIANQGERNIQMDLTVIEDT